jgi:hypothetical protein
LVRQRAEHDDERFLRRLDALAAHGAAAVDHEHEFLAGEVGELEARDMSPIATVLCVG